MRYIQKFFQSKKSIELFIEENGMEQAIKEFGINKLVMFKLINQYENTELYYYEYITIHKVYNKEGVYMGDITPLMCPYYKKLGYFFGPCKNGNILLSKLDEDKLIKTYGVFDKTGKQIIEYGKYPEFCFLPNGIALMNKSGEYKAVTVHIDGTVKTQPVFYFYTDGASGDYILYSKLYRKVGENEVVSYHVREKVVNDLTDSSIQIGTIEKGIE